MGSLFGRAPRPVETAARASCLHYAINAIDAINQINRVNGVRAERHSPGWLGLLRIALHSPVTPGYENSC